MKVYVVTHEGDGYGGVLGVYLSLENAQANSPAEAWKREGEDWVEVNDRWHGLCITEVEVHGTEHHQFTWLNLPVDSPV